MLLNWINAALFAVQLFVNSAMSRNIGPMSRKHETLITPAPYAFAIWGVIYTLLTLSVVVDCACPAWSFFGASAHPTLLRLLFAVSCVLNMAWIALFSHEYIHLSTIVLVALWGVLLMLYMYILVDRRQGNSSWLQYICSELGLNLYFAWTCAATLIAITVSLQEIVDGYLSLPAYTAMVSVLTVLTISALVYDTDVVFGLVAIWALVAIAVKSLELDVATERVSLSVRACCSQSAAVIAAFVFIALVHRFLATKR